ncbi:MAG: transposase [Syntrophomonadaceae bacterium]|nr:transposase [Syntrophomonadaceae bacterium]
MFGAIGSLLGETTKELSMSPSPRYHNTGRDSFLGEWAYQRLVQRHPNHFLVVLNRLFDWDSKSDEMIQMYQGHGRIGRPPYNPVLIYKMLFLSYLYNVSERAMEQLADEHLMVKWFLGLAVDEPAPDHSTLTAFKRRVLRGDNWRLLQKVFDDMLRQCLEYGLQFGELQVLDSVHTEANVNNQKDRDRQDRGGSSRDPEARVVNKGKRQMVQADGQRTTQEMRYRGYKTHTAVNAATGLVTSLVAALGNTADNEAFPALRAHDRALGLPVHAYGGDKAYDDTDIHERLAQEGLDTAITLTRQRTAKKDANKGRWLDLVADPTYQFRVKQRYRVEQPYGIAKQGHGFERCRYLGLARYRLQAFWTFTVVNAKRMIKLLTGVTFRPQAKGRKAEHLKPVLAATSWA